MPTTSYYITEEEKEMLIEIAKYHMRSMTGTVRYLINKEYLAIKGRYKEEK